MRRAQVTFQLLVLLAAPQQGEAAEPVFGRTVIVWKAVDGCPSEAEVIARVERYLSQPLHAPRVQEMQLRAEVRLNASNQYEVLLSTDVSSGHGPRHLTHTDCHELADATALVMALAIDPKLVEVSAPVLTDGSVERFQPTNASTEVGSSSSTDRPSPPPPDEWRPPNGSVRVNGTVSRAETPRSKKWRLTATGIVGQGLLPVIDLGATVKMAYSPTNRLMLRGGFLGYVPTEQSIPNNDATVVVRAGTLDFEGCIRLRDSRQWDSQACIGVEAGLIWGEGRGEDISNPRRRSAAYATAVVEHGFGYRLFGDVGVTGAIAGGIAVWRPRFGVVRNGIPEEDVRPNLASFRLGFGFFWDFR